MRRIRSTGMKPEMTVRRAVYRLGYRYRLFRRDLPGKPDLVFIGRRKVIFVHGCFWHQHPVATCRDARPPKSNVSYWQPKLARNAERDAQSITKLQKDGWTVLVIWECETNNQIILEDRLLAFLG